MTILKEGPRDPSLMVLLAYLGTRDFLQPTVVLVKGRGMHLGSRLLSHARVSGYR